jgi:hypothetical protein
VLVKIARDKRDERNHERRIKVTAFCSLTDGTILQEVPAVSILREDVSLCTEYGNNPFLSMLVPQFTNRYILEDCSLNIQGCENLMFRDLGPP